MRGGEAVRVMLGGAFSALLDGRGPESTFDSKMREAVLRTVDCLTHLGVLVRSSHIEDDFGRSFDDAKIAGRDIRWVVESDLYIALMMPNEAAESTRSDGTYVEIGIALALGRPVVVVQSDADRERMSYFTRGLEIEGRLKLLDWEAFFANLDDVLAREVAAIVELKSAVHSRHVVTQPERAFEILNPLRDDHEVDVRGIRISVSPGVFSPLVSHSPDFMAKHWEIERGSRLLDLGCGSGVLTLLALADGAGFVVASDKSSAAVRNTRRNLVRHGLENRASVVETMGYDGIREMGPFDGVILSPPFWDRRAKSTLEEACYDEGHAFMMAGLRGARDVLNPHGRVYLVFSDQGDTSLLGRLISSHRFWIEKFVVGRPSSEGHHVRLFLQLRVSADWRGGAGD